MSTARALLVIAMIGIAGAGAWLLLAPGFFPGAENGQEPAAKTGARNPNARRSAPYVTLVPAQTLPGKSSSAGPPASATRAEPALVPSQLGETADTAEKKQAAPGNSPPAAPDTVKISAVARQALAAVSGAQEVSQPGPKREAQPAAPQVSPPGSRTSSISDEAARKTLQLKYETETSLQEQKPAEQPSLAGQKNMRFHNIVPVSPGRLKADGKIIDLADIKPLGADAKCEYASGDTWDCGRRGTFALRRLIRGRSIVCDLLEETPGDALRGRCTVAGTDIGRWIVQRGWGQPAQDTGASYAAELKAAKAEKLGQWSEGPASTN